MTELPQYNLHQSHVRPAPGKDFVGNEYEDLTQIVIGTEVQGWCFVGRGTWLNNITSYPHTKIGRYCSIARGAALGAPSHPLDGLSTAVLFPSVNETMPFFDTEIGHDVWVGANATILAGVKVGVGAVIGAGAVVTKDVRPYAIMTGIPAREVRRRFTDDVCQALLVSRWWELPHNVLLELPMGDIRESLRRITAMRKEASNIEPEAIEHLEHWLSTPMTAREEPGEQEAGADLPVGREAELETALAMALERSEARTEVLNALIASLRPLGFDRRGFRKRVTELGRQTPNDGLRAIKHSLLLEEARRVLGKTMQKMDLRK